MRANVIALAGMKNALINLKKLEIPVKFIYESTEGLSGYFKDERLQEFKDSMTRIELSLAQMVDGVQLPSLGYGKAEALFAVQDWNAPNSNFPVMWWPKYSDMSDRNTILRRSEL